MSANVAEIVGFNDSDYSSFGNIDFQNAVDMNNISWEEQPQTPGNNMLNAKELAQEINNVANKVQNADELNMFLGCTDDPIAGDSMCFLTNPQPINYRYNNTNKEWINFVGDKAIMSGYDADSTVKSNTVDVSRRGLEYLKLTNKQLLVQPLCDVYDCANKKDDPNCRALNCMK
jgi:hypothetical protein